MEWIGDGIGRLIGVAQGIGLGPVLCLTTLAAEEINSEDHPRAHQLGLFAQVGFTYLTFIP
jgi:hypothetical protein